jgi:Flp pilus assembly protein TadG
MRNRRPTYRASLADRRGVATVEFALWSLLILAALLPCLDFATYLILEGRLGSAVQQASVLAYNMRNSDAINTAQLIGYVPSTASLPGSAVTTTVVCNGGAQSCAVPVASRQCSCVSGLTPTYTAASACGTSCPNGATSGYYLTIRASYPYHAMDVPDRWLDGSTMTRAVTVRLQ